MTSTEMSDNLPATVSTWDKLKPKVKAFVMEYVIDLDGAKAARRAGYSHERARITACQLLQIPAVAAEVQRRLQERSERTAISADNVLREWRDIATANPAELVRYRVRACRHCHGIGHAYQWVSEAEFEHAVAEHGKGDPKGKKEPPSAAGGFGYSTALKPNPECFRCLGDGIADVVLPDTTNLSPAAAKLYAGVKQTREGIEVKLRDQDAALLNLAKHLGMFPSAKVELTGKDGGPMQVDSLVQFYLPTNGR